MNLEDIKLEYLRDPLEIGKLEKNPYDQLTKWFNEVIKAEVSYPNAATLATVDDNGYPQARIVLLKDISDRKITFYTNYESDKGEEIAAHPKVCINLFWKEFDRQVRLVGTVEKTSFEESEKYFQSRPLESQISAIASNQSHVVDKEALYNKVKEISSEAKGKEVLPCPKNWGGFNLNVEYFEFWQGRPNRLHDRFAYQDINQWNISRLSP